MSVCQLHLWQCRVTSVAEPFKTAGVTNILSHVWHWKVTIQKSEFFTARRSMCSCPHNTTPQDDNFWTVEHSCLDSSLSNVVSLNIPNLKFCSNQFAEYLYGLQVMDQQPKPSKHPRLNGRVPLSHWKHHLVKRYIYVTSFSVTHPPMNSLFWIAPAPIPVPIVSVNKTL